MYSSQPSFVLGFHGCDKAVADGVLGGNRKLRPSVNEYDWLGNGIYFWENDPERALLFATQTGKRRAANIKVPAVIGAVINLGYCLNLIEADALQIVKAGYQDLVELFRVVGAKMPVNRKAGDSSDLLLRQS